MAEIPQQPSREEREFWDVQFRDPPRASRPGRDAPRREQRLARAPDGLLTRLADRVHDWRADARLGVVVLVVVALVAGVAWYRIGIGDASAGAAGAPPRAVTTTAERAPRATATTAKGQPSTIAVHVAGAVTHPGVVELRAGARVIDAVEAVGGALGDGDLDRLNLAAKVTDGQRVYVAKVGQADPGVTNAEGDGTGTDPAAADGSGALSGAKVNLNTATQAQLEALPGIGPTYAQAILAERQRRGGFGSVNDLRSVRGIGDKRFAELAPLVTV
jgi:competence protein ComEA